MKVTMERYHGGAWQCARPEIVRRRGRYADPRRPALRKEPSLLLPTQNSELTTQFSPSTSPLTLRP